MFIILNKKYKKNGFTLVEILIALFIFTIIGFILSSALRGVIDVQSGTEKKAVELQALQIAFLTLSRDIEQAVNRPVMNAQGKEEAAFVGDAHQFILTRTGVARSLNEHASGLQRVAIVWKENTLLQRTTDSIDRTIKSHWYEKKLLDQIDKVDFYYIDEHKHAHQTWPIKGENHQPLPRAVKIVLTFTNGGMISQLYVVPTEPFSMLQDAVEKF